MQNNKLNILRYLLAPLSVIYGLIVLIRNKLFDYNFIESKEFKIPIISVGNITAGGTGKTPHIEYLISLLKEEFKVAILSRGYKRKTKKFILATSESTSDEIGDEPKQIKQKFPDVDVAVENYRVKGINKLITEKKDLKVILLDDAYQHRYVNPGLSILLIDYNRPLSKDYLLPFGNLREPSYEKRRANIIIITKSPKKLKPIEKRIITKDLKLFPYQTSYFTTTKYGRLTPVFNSNKNILTEIDCKKNKITILLVTGIANPRPLKKHIRGISPKIDQLNFPDHHSFTEEDIQHIIKKFKAIKNLNKIIITTEKDAMRFQNFMNIDENIKSLMYFIPIGIEFPDDAADIFNNQIINYVRKNKRNSILYSK